MEEYYRTYTNNDLIECLGRIEYMRSRAIDKNDDEDINWCENSLRNCYDLMPEDLRNYFNTDVYPDYFKADEEEKCNLAAQKPLSKDAVKFTHDYLNNYARNKG